MNKFKTKLTINNSIIIEVKEFFSEYALPLLIMLMAFMSILSYAIYSIDGLALAYNDARSHLNIGRRVVEGLTPGLAQIGSVWLPLPHLLMAPTVWIDFMWQSGLSGAIQSMVSFVLTGVLIYAFLRELKVGLFGRLIAVAIFALNINVLYLQSTAMTELLLIFTMTAGTYYLLLWHKKEEVLDIVKAAFFIMLSTMVRYDGWFLLIVAAGLVFLNSINKAYSSNVKNKLAKAYTIAEGNLVLFGTLAGLGIIGWFLWNFLIFGDPLYFAFGEFSAHAQQTQLEAAGDLDTKYDLLLSMKVYLLAFVYNVGVFPIALGIAGLVYFLFDKRNTVQVKLASLALLTPLVFNILALYLGHSTIFVQGISGNSWFNIRYGVLTIPVIAIFAGYFMDRIKLMRWPITGILIFVMIFSFASTDAVTIEDARFGSSQKNVTEISSWLRENVANEKGYVLVSVASHDAIVFDSGMHMKRFIHEGTGKYWRGAVVTPDRYARWIIVRTYDQNDLVWRQARDSAGFGRYNLIESFPFADVYELDEQYLEDYYLGLSSVGLKLQ